MKLNGDHNDAPDWGTKIRWGISYNVFEDSIELLPHSIKSIRESVDYVNVVFQNISNHGRKTSINYEPFLKDLMQQGLIDELTYFSPRHNNPHMNETDKRNVGRKKCEQNKCDYFMSMDSDELYIKEEFEYMKKVMVEGNYDAGACQMLTYYKSDKYVLDPPEDYYVPLFYKTTGREFVLASYWPILVDPTRRIMTDNPRIFTREEIQMHHLTYVRQDISKKFLNSSALVNFHQHIDTMIQSHKNFDGSTLIADMGTSKNPLKKVEPIFNIEF